jgi:hypothetical protein
MGVQDQEAKFFLEGHANTRADKNKALILMRSTEWHIRRWSAENVATRRNTIAQNDFAQISFESPILGGLPSLPNLPRVTFS